MTRDDPPLESGGPIGTVIDYQASRPWREYLRCRGAPVSQTMQLQDRDDGVVRMSLMRMACDAYDEIPESVEQVYLPDEHCIVIPLPDPDGDTDPAQATLSITDTGDKATLESG